MSDSLNALLTDSAGSGLQWVCHWPPVGRDPDETWPGPWPTRGV